MNKGIVFGLVFLFVMIGFTSISGIQIDNNVLQASGRNSIRYVGGSSESYFLNQVNLDQCQLGTNGGYEKIFSNNECIQSFQPSRDTITRIELFISHSQEAYNHNYKLVVSIKESLDKDALGFCKLSPEEIPSYPGDWVNIDISDISVEDHKTYYIVCSMEYGDEESCCLWYFNEDNPEIDSYKCGEMIVKSGKQFRRRPAVDFSFKVFAFGDGDVERWAISMGFDFDACRRDARNLQYVLHNNSPEIWLVDNFRVFDDESTARWANILDELRWIESREDSNDITIWQSAGHGNEIGLYDDHTTLTYDYLDREFDEFEGFLLVIIVACNSNDSHDFLGGPGRIIMTGRSHSLPLPIQENIEEGVHTNSYLVMRDVGTYFIRRFVRSENGYAWFNSLCDTLFGNNDGLISAEEAFDFVLNSFDWPMYDSHGYLYPHITDGIEGDLNITMAPNPNSPYKPDKPDGPVIGQVGKTYTYATATIDPDDDDIYYLWDWGDGNDTEWLGPYLSGDECEASHIWDEKENYKIRVRAKDEDGHLSPWSDSLTITVVKSKDIVIKQQNKVFDYHSFIFDKSILKHFFQNLKLSQSWVINHDI
jgi:hypothetical protein